MISRARDSPSCDQMVSRKVRTFAELGQTKLQLTWCMRVQTWL